MWCNKWIFIFNIHNSLMMLNTIARPYHYNYEQQEMSQYGVRQVREGRDGDDNNIE